MLRNATVETRCKTMLQLGLLAAICLAKEINMRFVAVRVVWMYSVLRHMYRRLLHKSLPVPMSIKAATPKLQLAAYSLDLVIPIQLAWLSNLVLISACPRVLRRPTLELSMPKNVTVPRHFQPLPLQSRLLNAAWHVKAIIKNFVVQASYSTYISIIHRPLAPWQPNQLWRQDRFQESREDYGPELILDDTPSIVRQIRR